jgi:hypothetical protein
MTVCAGKIIDGGAYVVCDTRATLARSGLATDDLLKAIALPDKGLLCFAGDVGSVQAMLSRLEHDFHVKPNVGTCLKRAARMQRYLTKLYMELALSKHAQFLYVAADERLSVLMRVFLPGSTHRQHVQREEALVIGEDDHTRTHLERSFRDLDSRQWRANLPLVMGSMLNRPALLHHLGSKSQDQLSVGGLFLTFRVSAAGVDFMPHRTLQFRGGLADRNEPLGHAPIYETAMEDGAPVFVDLQEGWRRRITDVRHFDYKPRGTIKTSRDPHTLKKG